jgi:hypothetical protein
VIKRIDDPIEAGITGAALFFSAYDEHPRISNRFVAFDACDTVPPGTITPQLTF